MTSIKMNLSDYFSESFYVSMNTYLFCLRMLDKIQNQFSSGGVLTLKYLSIRREEGGRRDFAD